MSMSMPNLHMNQQQQQGGNDLLIDFGEPAATPPARATATAPPPTLTSSAAASLADMNFYQQQQHQQQQQLPADLTNSSNTFQIPSDPPPAYDFHSFDDDNKRSSNANTSSYGFDQSQPQHRQPSIPTYEPPAQDTSYQPSTYPTYQTTYNASRPSTSASGDGSHQIQLTGFDSLTINDLGQEDAEEFDRAVAAAERALEKRKQERKQQELEERRKARAEDRRKRGVVVGERTPSDFS